MNIKAYLNNKKNIYILITSLLTVVLFVCTFISLDRDTFYNGIFVDGIDVSGLKLEEAISILREKNREEKNKKIILKYKDNTWKFGLDSISYNRFSEEAIKTAYRYGHSGNVFQRLGDIIRLKFKKVMVIQDVHYDRVKAREKLLNIKKEIEKGTKNAKIKYDKGIINFDKESIGIFLDIDTNTKILENNILERNFNSITIEVREIKPEITYDDIRCIQYINSVFSTFFNAGDADRSYNIRLACERINGTVLLPRKVFSMDKALGKRTAENGYRDAPVIFKNELVKGSGGGVCQVTTTLYNSVLLSKLQVRERTPHSIPLGYVEPGQDATIAENYIDFKFENTSDYAIAINAEVEGNKINIRILGKRKEEDTIVKLVSQVVEEFPPQGEELVIDNSLSDIERVISREPKNGLKSILYRDTYNKDGTFLQREKISEDIYKSVKPQIKVNQATYDRLKGIKSVGKEGL